MVDMISPLAGLAQPGEFGALTASPGVTLSERLPVALVQVQCWPDTEKMCRSKINQALKIDLGHGKMVSQSGDCIVMPTGPGRWLIESEDVGLESQLREALPADVASVTSLAHGRIVIEVSGEKSAWLLATGIALDFHLDSFPAGHTQVSHHHEIGLTIHRTGENSFQLYLFTSFARAFWQWLSRAAAEVGYRVN